MEPLLIFDGRPEDLFIGLAARIRKQCQNGSGIFIFNGFFGPAPVIGEGNAVFGPEPQTCRKHGPQCIVKGAKVPFPDKGRQPQHICRNHRLFVQNLFHGLESCFITGLKGQDHTLAAAVAPSEGHCHPLSGTQVHPLRDAVGIGLVDGKISRRDRYFCNQKSPSPKV